MNMDSLFLAILFLFLISLEQSSSIHGWNLSDPTLTQIARDLYHSSDDLLDEVRNLVSRHPDKLHMEVIQAANKGYSTEILVATYGHINRETGNNTDFRILLSFGQHGRELITSEVALQLLFILSGEHAMLGLESGSSKNSSRNLVIKIIPMENLNGRKLVEAGDACERRNGRGVDLNRNWSVDWGKMEKDFDPYEEFPGPFPFSEPEVQIMQEVSKSFNPHVWVNVHSGMEGLFMPYDHRNTTPSGVASHAMKSVLEELNHHHCHDRCVVGSGGGSVGYLAHGTATDYMYEVAKVPLAFTFEIYGDEMASSKECFKMFNPIDVVTFKRVVNDWCLALLRIFQTAPQHLEMVLSKVTVDDDALDASLTEAAERTRVKMLDFGIQELKTYFRLFILSSVVLLFMFCSRISRSKRMITMPNIVI